MKTIVRRIALGISLTATALAGAAYAAQDDAHGDKRAPQTRAEAQTRAQAQFARMDANKDGRIDKADHAARQAARQTARFDRLDADHNGQISRAEFAAAGPRGGEPGEHRWGGRGGHRGHGMMHGGMPGMMPGAMADANKDGAITQAEFTAAALQRFDRADANRDGTVTPEERQAARQAMRDEMRQRWQDRASQPTAGKTN